MKATSTFSSPKVAIIGTGTVGSSVAFACLMQSVASEYILYDLDESLAQGQTLDLEDAAFISSAKIYTAVTDPYSSSISSVPSRASTLKVPISDCGQADIIVMAAGFRQAPGESRDLLLQRNELILKDVLSKIQPIKPSAILIMVANPVNILTYMAQKLSGLPANQVFGSGTLLDTVRLRGAIKKALDIRSYSNSQTRYFDGSGSDSGHELDDDEDSTGSVDENSIQAYVVGDHGDRQVALWSSATIAGQALATIPELKSKATQTKIAQQTKNRIYEIVDRKEASGFGIGAIIAHLISVIVYNKRTVIPLSVYSERYDACIAMPVVLGRRGVGRIIYPKMSEQEEFMLQDYVRVNQETCSHYRQSGIKKRPAESQLVKEK